MDVVVGDTGSEVGDADSAVRVGMGDTDSAVEVGVGLGSAVGAVVAAAVGDVVAAAVGVGDVTASGLASGDDAGLFVAGLVVAEAPACTRSAEQTSTHAMCNMSANNVYLVPHSQQMADTQMDDMQEQVATLRMQVLRMLGQAISVCETANGTQMQAVAGNRTWGTYQQHHMRS